MRDRLIELIGQARAMEASGIQCKVSNGYIADYLLAEGVIVPPCKVGATVYRITKLYNGETIIVEGEAFEFAITNELAQKTQYRFYFWAKPDKNHTSREYSIWCEFTDFGKTVFLTHEEAEKALAEGGDDNGN